MEKYNNKRNIIFNPNKVQKWNVEKNTIITTSRNHVDKLSEPFDYLRKNANDGYSDYQELIEANTIARKKSHSQSKKIRVRKNSRLCNNKHPNYNNNTSNKYSNIYYHRNNIRRLIWNLIS